MTQDLIAKNWRELIRPRELETEGDGATDVYGRFSCEPLERGFGVTLGNALRRVLLSSLQGAAVTAIRIEGVLHEFSTIPGVMEDVTEIVLNVKSLVVKNHSDSTRVITVEKNEAGKITGAGSPRIVQFGLKVAF